MAAAAEVVAAAARERVTAAMGSFMMIITEMILYNIIMGALTMVQKSQLSPVV
jgi:hypothetical protein